MKPVASGAFRTCEHVVQFIICILLFLFNTQVYSQDLNNPAMEAIAEPRSNDFMVYYKPTAAVNPATMFTDHAAAFGLVPGVDEMKIIDTKSDNLGYTHYRYQQYYQGLEVDGYKYLVHAKNYTAVMSNGDMVSGLSLSASPSLSEQDAIFAAMDEMGAQVYYWQHADMMAFMQTINGANYSSEPEGILMVMNLTPGGKDPNDFNLVYKVDLYAIEPHEAYSMYVDANTGAIVRQVPLFLNACIPTTGLSMFDGQVAINTNHLGGTDYILHDECQSGPSLGIFTMVEITGNSYSNVLDNNNDNTWQDPTQSLYVQAHFGTRATFDYYYNNHGWNSYDDHGAPMYSVISYNNISADNAYWAGAYTVYGPPANYFDEHVLAVDVVGHEYTHGVIQNSADLDYSGGESGALNESFADIFGAMVEWQSAMTPDWLIGEDVWDPSNGVSGTMDFLRNMQAPKTQDLPGYEQPDTYMGQYWNNGGNHTKSGVQNFWFYLLCEGSNATDEINDVGGIWEAGDVYHVDPLDNNSVQSRQMAAAIAFRNLTVYLTDNSDHYDARDGSIQAAIDLYGPCSHQVKQVINAWYAVGLGFDCVQACVDVDTDVDGNTCTANQTSSATVTILTGTPPYTYLWNDGQTSATAVGLTNGNYSVTVTDGNNCTEIYYFDITALSGSVQLRIEDACFDVDDGAMYAQVSGGATPYTYSWSNTSTNAFITDLAPGLYSVTITDANNCTTSLSGTVTELAQMALDLQLIYGSNCGYPTGAVDATVTNGVPDFEFSWMGPGSSGLATKEEDPTSLVAGAYTVSVTDDNGCTATNNITVPSLQGMDITVNYTISDANVCAGEIVTIVFTVCNTSGTNPTGPIDLQVTAIPLLGITVVPATSDFDVAGHLTIDPNDLPAGGPCLDYQLDIQGNRDQAYTLELQVPGGACPTNGPILIPLDVSAFFLDSYNITELDCNGDCDGAIDLTIIGGRAPFSYVWDNGATTQNIDNLCAGLYRFTFTDTYGCTLTQGLTLNDPPLLTTNITATSPACNGTVLLDANASGGTNGYSYFWHSGATTHNLFVTAPGTFGVTVTDGNGCTAEDDITVAAASGIQTQVASQVSDNTPCAEEVVTIIYEVCNTSGVDATLPVLLDLSLTIPGGINILPTSDFDINGHAQIDAIDFTNGACVLLTLNFSVDDGGGTGVVQLTLTNACSNAVVFDNFTVGGATGTNVWWAHSTCDPLCQGYLNADPSAGIPPYTIEWSDGNIDNIRTDVCAGSYFVTVTDALGCEIVKGSYDVMNSFNINITFPVVNYTNCGNSTGSATADATGGTSPYIYQWSNGTNGTTISNQPAGTYSVSVTDDNGCSAEGTVTIINTDGVTFTLTPTDATCFTLGGAAISNVAGGDGGPYTYTWHDGPGAASRNDLNAGTYNVTVTDGSGCTEEESFTIMLSGNLGIIADITPKNCSVILSGAIDITVTGGSGNYTYNWSNNEITEDIAGLLAGIYTVTVQDGAGCSVVASYTVNDDGTSYMIDPPAAVITDAGCDGTTNGAIDITVEYDAGPLGYQPVPGGLTFEWNQGTAPNTANEDQLGLLPGTYSVTVTNQYDCQVSGIYVVGGGALGVSGAITHVNCSGGFTGAIDLTVTGGSAPYTYTWDDGTTTMDRTNLGAGSYTVTVASNGGACQVVETFIVTEAFGIGVWPFFDPNDCFGECNASIGVWVVGGTPGYTYTWNPPVSATNIASNLCAGTYRLTVQDANGCQATRTYAMVDPPELVVNGTVIDDCDGAGSIDLTVTGGTGTITYSWVNGSTTQDQSNLTAGTYTVTVSDALGCQKVQSFTVNNINVDMDVTHTNVLCYGDNNGTITVNAPNGQSHWVVLSGSVSDIYYGTNKTWGNLLPGTYTVTMYLGNCTRAEQVVITEPSWYIGIMWPGYTTCNGVCDGALSVSVFQNSTPPYTYTWNPPVSTGQSASGLCPGTYNVTVTDANGCETQLSSSIAEPTEIIITGVVKDDCNNGNRGSIDITISGGVGGYTYLWSNTATTQDLTGIGGGSYTVTVTDSRGCTVEETFNVSGTSYTMNVTTNNISCYGANDGSISVTVTPTQPYLIALDGPQTTYIIDDHANFTNLPPGTYTLSVWREDCGESITIVIEEPDELILNNPTASAQTSCNGACDASLTIDIAQNSTPPYTYTWSPAVSTGPTASGLCPGNYSATVTDANGCEAYFSGEVKEALDITLTGTTEPDCNGGLSGAIDLTVSGGSGSPYTYLWNNGATTQDLTGLEAGTYTVTVTDNAGCQQIASFTVDPLDFTVNWSYEDVSCFGGSDASVSVNVTPHPLYILGLSGAPQPNFAFANSYTWSNLPVGNYTLNVLISTCYFSQPITIGQPDALQLSFTTNDGCSDQGNGSITVTPVGGTGPYTYLWTNSATTATISNLSPGTYSVTVTDANGCEEIGTATVINPPVLDVNIVINTPSCGGTGGSATATPIGGTPPYSIYWYDFTPAQIGAGPTISGLAPGMYEVHVYDANDCFKKKKFVIENVVPYTITMQTTDIDCNTGGGGTASVTINGNYAQPLTYVWSGPGINAGNQNNTSQVGLPAGTYDVTVTDASGCSATASGVVNNGNLVVTATAESIDCANPTGSASVTNISGGTGPYSYLWNTTAVTATIGNLAAGTYTVTVTDANGCIGTASATVNINGASFFSLDQDMVNPSCAGDADGSFKVGVLVTPPTAGTYAFTWSANVTATVNDPGPPPTETAYNLAAGTYSVTVTNGLGCEETVTVTLTDPTPVSISATTSDPTTPGGADGSIDLTVSGGTPGYAYTWSTGQNTEDLSGLTAGTYCVTVIDEHGCTVDACFELVDPIQLILTPQDESCFNADDGGITTSVTGMTLPLTYVWSNGATTSSLSNLPAGTYAVTVTDALGATVSGTTTVGQPSQIVPTFVVDGPACTGGTANIDLEVSGGDPPYTYLWHTGVVTQDLMSVLPGIYTVTITDASGCEQIGQVVVADINPIGVTLQPVNPGCALGNDGSINTTVSGGTPPYTFSWSNGSTIQNPSGLATGNYTVTVTDANGCTAIQTTLLIDPMMLSVQAYPYDEQCSDMNGGINLVVNGGTLPYTFNWTNGDNSQNISGLSAGNYGVTVIDANGCQAVVNNIFVNDQGLAISFFTIDPSCGQMDGVIVVDAPGASPPVTYSWSNGVVTQNPVLSGLGAGTYTVTVTSALNCVPETGCSAVATVILNDGGLTVSAIVVDEQCGTPGYIELFVAGGTPTYNFNWSNGAQTQNLTGLTAGSYSVTVMDALGCMYTNTYVVNSVNANLMVWPNVFQPNCGQPDGFIELTVMSGMAPYTYNWSNGGIGSGIYNLDAGTYEVTVTDMMGACFTQTFMLNYMSSLLITSTVVDASCGYADGEITIDVNNGTYPFSFVWSNGATTQNLTGLLPGTYTVTVTDDVGCTASHIVDVLQNGSLAYDVLVEPPVCQYSDGQVYLEILGGTLPYTYEWNDGTFAEYRTNLAPGFYSITMTDGAGCSSVFEIELESSSPLILDLDELPGSCGNNDGSIDLTVYYGNAPYFYNWSNGSTTEDVDNLGAGTYSVTVYDDNGCTATASVDVYVDPDLPLDLVTVYPTCGNSDGELTIAPLGGAAPYSYLWSTGATTATIANLPVGIYHVTVTDANGCTGTVGGGLSNLFGLNLSIDVVPEMLACGGNNAELLVVADAVNPPVTFVWSNGATGPLLTGLSEGTYVVTATDANGCVSVKEEYIWYHTDGLYFDADIQNPYDCNSSDGYISLQISAGQAPYTFTWSNGAGSSGLYGLSPGQYDVTVTDANGCSGTGSYNLTGDEQISVDQMQVIPASCGMSDGSILIEVAGSTGPYTYQWTDGSNVIAVTEDLFNVPTGSYGVNIIDVNGCTLFYGMLFLPDEGDLMIDDVATVNPNCGASDGSITVTVNSSNPPLTFLWSDGATSQNRTNLPEGGHSVTVTDANGCVDEQYVLLSSSLLSSYVSMNELCGDANGEIHLTITGGTLPYTYNWSNGATGPDLVNLSAGTYAVTVLDMNGCSFYREFIIDNFSNLALSGSYSHPTTCSTADGAININVGGAGVPPYSFAWSDGATTQNRIGLAAGIYTVTVTDDEGCTAEYSANLFGSLSLAATVTDESCQLYDGAIDLDVQSGTQPYSYYWNDGNNSEDLVFLEGGNYSVTVIDANNCTGTLNATVESNAEGFVFDYVATTPDCGLTNGAIDVTVAGGQAPYTFSWANYDGSVTSSLEDPINLAGDIYTLTITDANGCIGESFHILEENNGIQLNIDIIEPSCGFVNDGSIVINPTGGIPPYSYEWPDQPNVTGNNQQNLEPGFYPVIVTDANGCVVVEPIWLVNNSQVQATYTVQHIDCNNPTGSIDLTVSGTPAYFEWSHGPHTEDVTGLQQGTYDVIFVDNNLCVNLIQGIQVREVDPIDIVENASSATCGNSDGAMDIEVSGGTPPYTYLWSNGATTEDITGVPSGVYGLTITDANGCIEDGFLVLVDETNSMLTNVVVTNATCGLSDGTITLTPSGGVAPYTYDWIFDGSTSQNRTGLEPGVYVVIITDDNGCNDYQLIFVEEDGQMSLTPTIQDVECGVPGTISLAVNGGAGGFTYLWSDGQTTSPANFASPGNYTVTVTDVNGCEVIGNYMVNDVGQTVVSDFSASNSNPILGQNVLFDNLSSGSGTITYEWQVDGVPVSNGFNFDYTFNDPVVVTITLLVTNGVCTNQFSMVFDLTGGLRLAPPRQDPDRMGGMDASVLTNKDISIYPNPTDGNVTVRFNSKDDWMNDARIEVYNPVGEQMKQVVKLVPANGMLKMEVLNGKAAGVYMFRVQTASGYYLKKVILTF